jgi:hypothetical protein
MASSTSANLEANNGGVRLGCWKRASRLREEAERGSDWSMATSTFPTVIYPKLRALRRWVRLGCKVERMSRREGVGRGRNEQQRMVREGPQPFILIPWLGVYGALVERDWTARAVFLDSVVR